MYENMKKNSPSNIPTSSPEHLEVAEGVICGVNIKPLKSKVKRTNGGRFSDKLTTTWGIWVHVRMDDGDQIDFIWKHLRSVKYQNFDMPRYENQPKKKALARMGIPTLLRIFMVDEWVDLIGTRVGVKRFMSNGVSPELAAVLIQSEDEEHHRWFISHYFEVFPGKFKEVDNG